MCDPLGSFGALELMLNEWQQLWDREFGGRYLHSVYNGVGIRRGRGGNGKEEVVMTKLRIGHSNQNSTLHIIGKHPTGFCGQCQACL